MVGVVVVVVVGPSPEDDDDDDGELPPDGKVKANPSGCEL